MRFALFMLLRRDKYVAVTYYATCAIALIVESRMKARQFQKISEESLDRKRVEISGFRNPQS